MTLRILNLYAGIGGNRKLWSGDIKVVAVENVPEIAKIYHDFFPDDEVVIADAHEYLLQHYKEFDFIWSSPPCPTHIRMRKSAMRFSNGGGIKAVFPDMTLYEEIIFLMGYFEGKWVVENVISWYEPLIKPNVVGRHYIWSNFYIDNREMEGGGINYSFGKNDFADEEVDLIDVRANRVGFKLDSYSGVDKEKILNNCVEPEMGLYIFDMAFKVRQLTIDEVGEESVVVESEELVKPKQLLTDYY